MILYVGLDFGCKKPFITQVDNTLYTNLFGILKLRLANFSCKEK
mgnify:CR=1 FL=1